VEGACGGLLGSPRNRSREAAGSSGRWLHDELSGVDGVPEARSQAGELYGFNRLSTLTLMAAHDIAKVAQNFGQEDDITVLTLALAPN
jgi:hypothetical protein